MKFSEFPARLGYPDLSREDALDNPLMILAGFPFRYYVTTSHHNFIELALKAAGKTPRMEFCRWRQKRDNIPLVLDSFSKLEPDKHYEPNEFEPLVYHLYGHDDYPESLVLTEDDYFQFLIAISQHKGQGTDVIPHQLRGVISYSALILLGYELRSWDFRILFWGLINSGSATTDEKEMGISVQVEPKLNKKVEKQYFEQYLEKRAKCEAKWVTVEEYTKKLREDLMK